MRDDTALSVEIVDARADDRAEVVVRCLRGTLRAGQQVRITEREGSSVSEPAPLTVRTIWRYGKAVDFIDRAHSGKLELVGEIGAINVGNLIVAC